MIGNYSEFKCNAINMKTVEVMLEVLQTESADAFRS